MGALLQELEKNPSLCYYEAMQTKAFNKILHRLSLQKGEEKLKFAFKLSEFVRRLHREGEMYAKKQSATRSRATA